MAGTKMSLKRYSGESRDFDVEVIIIDQAYIDSMQFPYIHINQEYVMSVGMLEVYLNGQLLKEGSGFEEVDPHTIKLLTDYPLEVGDELIVKLWKTKYIPNNTLQQYTEQAVITFIIPGFVLPGPQPVEIRFPFNGSLAEVYVSARYNGSGIPNVFSVQKISQDDYDSGLDTWIDVLTTDAVVDVGKRTSKASTIQPVVSTTQVNSGDHFRVFVRETDSLIQDVVVEVSVNV